MKNLGERNILRIPLAALQFAPDIRQKVKQREAAFRQHCLRLYSGYEPEEITDLLTQLRWALQNPGYDFQGILQGVTTSNEDILFYFAFLPQLIAQAECANPGITAPSRGCRR